MSSRAGRFFEVSVHGGDFRIVGSSPCDEMRIDLGQFRFGPMRCELHVPPSRAQLIQGIELVQLKKVTGWKELTT